MKSLPGPGKGNRKKGPRSCLTYDERYFRALAEEKAKEFIGQFLQPILETYIALAGGGKMKGVKVDPATVRHAIDKFVKDPPRETPGAGELTVEDLMEELEREDAAIAEAEIVKEKEGGFG